MCPACLTTVALIAAGASSTGGLGALVMRTLRGKSGGENAEPQPPPAIGPPGAMTNDFSDAEFDKSVSIY